MKIKLFALTLLCLTSCNRVEIGDTRIFFDFSAQSFHNDEYYIQGKSRILSGPTEVDDFVPDSSTTKYIELSFHGGNLGVIHPQQITAKIDVNVYDDDNNSVYYTDYVSDGNFFSEDFTSYEEYESIYGWISHCNFLIEIKINDLSVFANAEKIEIIFSLESTAGLYDTPLVSVIPVERENNKCTLGSMSKFDYLIN